jgi:hypothetical protein
MWILSAKKEDTGLRSLHLNPSYDMVQIGQGPMLRPNAQVYLPDI